MSLVIDSNIVSDEHSLNSSDDEKGFQNYYQTQIEIEDIEDSSENELRIRTRWSSLRNSRKKTYLKFVGETSIGCKRSHSEASTSDKKIIRSPSPTNKKSKVEFVDDCPDKLDSQSTINQFFQLEVQRLIASPGMYSCQPVCYQCEIYTDNASNIRCTGVCLRYFHRHCLTYPQDNPLPKEANFQCPDCWTKSYSCILCKKTDKITSLLHCEVTDCGRLYHKSCLDKSNFLCNDVTDSIKSCPAHFCVSCVREDYSFVNRMETKLFHCIRCPMAFHDADLCMAAGAIELSLSNVICPRHFESNLIKLSISKPVHTDWCFRCFKTGAKLPLLKTPTICDCTDRCQLFECKNYLNKVECDRELCSTKEHCDNHLFSNPVNKNLGVYKTSNRGFGLRTTVLLMENDFIIEYIGEIITRSTSTDRMNAAKRDNFRDFYMMRLSGDLVVDAGPKGNLSRFLNHSCDPNCQVERWTVDGYIRLGIFAMRNIEPKEELTFDYRQGGFIMKEDIFCLCNNPSCTGFLGPEKSSILSPSKSSISGVTRPKIQLCITEESSSSENQDCKKVEQIEEVKEAVVLETEGKEEFTISPRKTCLIVDSPEKPLVDHVIESMIHVKVLVSEPVSMADKKIEAAVQSSKQVNVINSLGTSDARKLSPVKELLRKELENKCLAKKEVRKSIPNVINKIKEPPAKKPNIIVATKRVVITSKDLVKIRLFKEPTLKTDITEQFLLRMNLMGTRVDSGNNVINYAPNQQHDFVQELRDKVNKQGDNVQVQHQPVIDLTVESDDSCGEIDIVGEDTLKTESMCHLQVSPDKKHSKEESESQNEIISSGNSITVHQQSKESQTKTDFNETFTETVDPVKESGKKIDRIKESVRAADAAVKSMSKIIVIKEPVRRIAPATEFVKPIDDKRETNAIPKLPSKMELMKYSATETTSDQDVRNLVDLPLKEIDPVHESPEISPKKDVIYESFCFRCFDGGDLVLCDKQGCPKTYHLSCIGLTNAPSGTWYCPWHFCNVCGDPSTLFCVQCPGSYCTAHIVDEHITVSTVGSRLSLCHFHSQWRHKLSVIKSSDKCVVTEH